MQEKENVHVEGESSIQGEVQPKKMYVKPLYQKHETLRVAAVATRSYKGEPLDLGFS